MSKYNLVLRGQWLYDNSVHKTVQIFSIDYDYYFEIAKADGQLETAEQPILNEHGETYMIKWDDNADFNSFGPRENGGLTLHEAKHIVEGKVGLVRWEVIS